jgi:hypothetical protein
MFDYGGVGAALNEVSYAKLGDREQATLVEIHQNLCYVARH